MSGNAERAEKALKESQSARESLDTLADLKKNDPDTYEELQNSPGN